MSPWGDQLEAAESFTSRRYLLDPAPPPRIRADSVHNRAAKPIFAHRGGVADDLVCRGLS
jgi:hypothetical protein